MSLLCELLAIGVKFILSTPIHLSESTSENLIGARGESPKFASYLYGFTVYEGDASTRVVLTFQVDFE